MSRGEVFKPVFIMTVLQIPGSLEQSRQSRLALEHVFSEQVKNPLTLQQSHFLTKTACKNKSGTSQSMEWHRPVGLASLEHKVFRNAINREKVFFFRSLIMTICYLDWKYISLESCVCLVSSTSQKSKDSM